MEWIRVTVASMANCSS